MTKKVSIEKHYCDSCIFVAFLNLEPKYYDKCKNLLDAAESGQIELFTSTFTMAEVNYIKDEYYKKQGFKPLTSQQKEDIIRDFFHSSWIKFVGFDRESAEINRYISRTFQIKPFDALHLATSIRLQVDYFNTIDGPLLRKIRDSPDTIDNSIAYEPHYPRKVIVQEPFVSGWTPKLF